MTSLTIVVFVWSQFRFQRGLLGIYTECGLYLKKLTSVLTVFVSCGCFLGAEGEVGSYSRNDD